MAASSRLSRSGSILAVGAALFLPLVVAVRPAGASPVATTTRTAVASWTQTGPGTPNVSLQITEESRPTSSYLFFFVNENYCDTAKNTAVSLSYLAQGPVTNQVFVVSRSLSNAVLVAPHLSVNFTEQTAPGCDTNGSDLTTVFSGPKTVSIFGVWLATGPPTTTFPGEVVRPATAAVTAKAPAPLTLANLGPPAFAQLSQYTQPA